jgi:dTDP-4-amino-4,6-dideoxygalactose transaminase
MIGFNKPYLTGRETEYIVEAVNAGKISGDGIYTKKCHSFFQDKYGFKKVFLTTSCTDALEMAALLIGIKEGDEVIMPSFTFVSTANAFVLRGAKVVFADSRKDHPGMDEASIINLVNSNTKAIVVVHYAGVATDMDLICKIASDYNLFVIEDAAQAIDSFYKEKPLGSFGHLAAFSFHETKNIMCGEGGMLVVNDEKLIERAEIIREKGTNRSSFFRGEIDKYGWVDIGSSFLPSDILAAFLYAQLEQLEHIQKQRKKLWDHYFSQLKVLQDTGILQLPVIPHFSTNNAHMFYIVCKDLNERIAVVEHLKDNNINAVFHYQSLHQSQYYLPKHDGRKLNETDRYSDCLLRLPMYFELTELEINRVTDSIKSFFKR